MNISVGNKVKFLNEEGEGVVKQILSDQKVLVENQDGFDLEYELRELIIINEDNSHQYNIDHQEIKDKLDVPTMSPKGSLKNDVIHKYMASTKYQFEKVIEVDLHLEELVEFPQRLDNWQKLHIQMQHVKDCLNSAMNNNIRRLVFVHGVGQGVLRTELRNYLHQFPNISMKDADMKEYGMGATEIYIKY